MSAVVEPSAAPAGALPLVAGPGARALAFGQAGVVRVDDFLAHVHGVAAWLPDGRHVLNLCEDRYRFLVLLCAAITRGQATLLPPSRAPGVVLEMLERHPGSHCVGDDALPGGIALERVPPRYACLPDPLPRAAGGVPAIDPGQLVAIGFTSGSSGPPKPQPKRWGAFVAGTALNAACVARACGGAAPSLVATVPPQHMYGMETSVLMPLLGGGAILAGRPFFPADIAAALAAAPAPRVLVTTPVHLRTLLASGVALPPVAAILSATAPLPAELAQAAEAACGARVLEFFGSTETCVIAHRETARTDAWTPHPGVQVQPQPDGSLVQAPWLEAPVLLHDLLERDAEGGFRLAGRCADHLEIAGKRASLGELTRRLLAVPGVVDGVVFQSDDEGEGGVRRIAALAVAPGLDEAGVLAALREAVDPVFLPRPLRLVGALPRNETGKLPRAALLAALRAGR